MGFTGTVIMSFFSPVACQVIHTCSNFREDYKSINSDTNAASTRKSLFLKKEAKIFQFPDANLRHVATISNTLKHELKLELC